MDYIAVCSFLASMENGNKVRRIYNIRVKESLSSRGQRARWGFLVPTSAPAGYPEVPGRSLLSSWEIVLNPPDEPHSDFCHTVSFQGVLDKLGLHSHLDLGDSGKMKG